MDKQKYFRKLVRVNRKLLLSEKFSPAILTMYAMGDRFPSKETAKRLAKLLGENLDVFPYLRRD
jgi:hypothetical protein